METQADPWQENVLLIAEALGKPDQAQELLDGFDDRCEDIKEGFSVEGTTANMVRPRNETRLSLYGPVSFAGAALECVGFTIPSRTGKTASSRTSRRRTSSRPRPTTCSSPPPT